jgi:glycosyltransferase involved in cell wall biosynthesis
MDGATDALGLLAPEVDAELLDVPVSPGHTWSNLRTFYGILEVMRPDLLVTSNWGSIEWALANLFARLQHLHLEDGFGPEEAERQFARRVWMRRFALRRSAVVVPSRTLHSIARDVWHLPTSRLLYIPNGIDCDRFTSITDPGFAAEVGLAAGEIPVIGTIARLRAEKNLRRLIDAFAEVLRQRPAILAIIGDGPERPTLTAHARALGIERSVVFTGNCRNPERLLASLTVFVLSSDTEQMPLSILEAMAAGRTIAATDVGDVHAMVAEENQPFVVKKDVATLARAILEILADPVRASIIGAANARRARELFDQRIMIAKYRRLFDGYAPTPNRSSQR